MARNHRRRTRKRRGLSPQQAPAPSRPRAAGATCARRAGEVGRGCAWATVGSSWGHVRGRPDPREDRRTDGPRIWPRGTGPGGGGGGGAGPSRRRGQSGAGGVRAGPMAAHEWALLSDRVMGRAARRSLTPAEGAPGGVTAGHRSAAWPGLPNLAGRRARAPLAPGARGVGRGTDTNWRGANKGPPPPTGRGTRARTGPLAPAGAHTTGGVSNPASGRIFPAHVVTELAKRPRLPDQKETGGPSRGHLRVQDDRHPALATMRCRAGPPDGPPRGLFVRPEEPLAVPCMARAPLLLRSHLIVLKSNAAPWTPWRPLPPGFQEPRSCVEQDTG